MKLLSANSGRFFIFCIEVTEVTFAEGWSFENDKTDVWRMP
jgi:hypothetical protein